MKESKPPDLLAHLLAGVPAGVAVAGGRINPGRVTTAYPEETAHLASAVAKRRAEFAAGREYAREALLGIGVRAGPIAVGAGRAPCWPAGVCGSISHSSGLCLAAVAGRASFLALGLDIESSAPLGDGLVERVCRPDELPPPVRAGAVDVPKLIFSIKESVYKAYFPEVGVFLDFPDVRVDLDLPGGRFDARIANPDKPSLFGVRRLAGVFGAVGKHLYAFTALENRS